ncbi:hypothetical protein EVAR_67820_1 [Eumeta japonica]|uniref:Uncharacterized protein n=1 Tax=Eumeta variegata TaxID=151549 RepID=A0A4C1ZTC8_EUMVA|nr:hypothetical protein EVAR_67820_1 [Eumeta japonica]
MENDNIYDVDVKITERAQTLNAVGMDDGRFHDQGSMSPVAKAHFDSHFIPFEKDVSKGKKNESLDFDDSKIGNTSTRNNYSRNLTKQQLSLVEEESIPDLESVPSQNLSSSSLENSDGFIKLSKTIENINQNLNNGNNHFKENESKKLDSTSKSVINEENVKSYDNFYADFNHGNSKTHNTDLSSTRMHSDVLSKDSEYQEIILTEEKNFKNDYSLPNSTSLFAERNTKIYSYQPRSLENISINEDSRNIFTKSIASDIKNDWKESLSHSRLLHKDFFLNVEGTPFVPQSPRQKRDVGHKEAVPSVNSSTNDIKNENIAAEYPSYLLNSTTKAYTSKVIEDYKKEIQAINNMHDLTLKDIKTDTVSPTPLHLDRMVEEHAELRKEKSNYGFQDSKKLDVNSVKTTCNTNKQDITKVSTKELIQNYLKVKGGDYIMAKNSKKSFTKSNSDGEESTNQKWDWKNKVTNNEIDKNFKNSSLKNQTKNNDVTYRNIPLSARIESVQNDKDVVSWMSMSAPSPRVFEVDEICDQPIDKSKERDENIISSGSGDATKSNTQKVENKDKNQNIEELEVHKPRELTNNSTVFDIYSMLREIESYGENPFHVNKSESEPQNSQEEEKISTPKDNFILETLLRLPQTELAQRLVTASLQLEERSCCIALLQESLSNHKEQVGALNSIWAIWSRNTRTPYRKSQSVDSFLKY